MTDLKRTRLAAILLAFLTAPPALADVAEREIATGPVMVELFTSQSCSSCPPAEAIFREMATRDDLVVIEWHVDYWNRLSHGSAGKWQDPYSEAAHTERQRAYNVALRGTGSVYTPQAIVNGRTETVGSRDTTIAGLISRETDPATQLAVTQDRITIVPPGEAIMADAAVYVVTLLPEQVTEVRGGENQGRSLASRNVAVGLRRIGTWTGAAASFALPKQEAGLTCAVFVQDLTTMNVLGASYCAPQP